PYRFGIIHKDYADCIGFRHAFLVGDPEGTGFSINIDDLKRMLDLVS
ncbi:hypothetical protein SCG7086_CH_00010, partial [Chlamydiales bacterium SCGC AG-110-P3]